MAKIIENSRMGVCKFIIESIEDLNTIDKTYIEASSEAYLINNNGMRIFILKSDKSGWAERASSSVGVQPFNRNNL